MHTGNKRLARIAQLNQHPEHVETVAGWILNEWGASSLGYINDSLIENKGCPPTLIALSSEGPMGVLGYKLHLLTYRNSVELWINVIYVPKPWRRQGIGRRLLVEGMKAAKTSGRNVLYVYTDIPTFYERFGWQRFRYNDDTEMHVLEHCTK